MRLTMILLLSSIFILKMQAQKYFTRTGKVSFHSKTLLEDIDAYNNQGTFVLDGETGDVQMAVLIKAFQFKKALMQVHFNENYMESTRYPKAIFKGKIRDFKGLDTSREGTQEIKISGSLTIHGVSMEIETIGTISVTKGKILATSRFPISISDFRIHIPSINKDKIAKTVDLKIDLILEKMN